VAIVAGPPNDKHLAVLDYCLRRGRSQWHRLITGGQREAPSAEFWPLYLRGQAYLQLKDGQAAGAEFQNILDHRGESPDSLLYPLALLGRARAAAMTGDIARAGTAYREVLDVWRDADANLQPFEDARKEQARLR
jgi:hypothetical protein